MRTANACASRRSVWLREDLKNAEYPAVLFSHQRLTAGHASILNPEPVREVLKAAPHGVVLALNGHEHVDSAEKVDNTWFLNVNSMSNYWLDVKFMCPERYGKEIDEKYPNIKYTVSYVDSVYAIVTLDETGARVQGTKSEFVGISPQEQGVYKGGGYFSKVGEGAITPSMADRFLPFK